MTPRRRDIALHADPADYDKIRSQHPWIVAREQNAVLSPDGDGFLSALFLCHYLNWRVVGFYDGKALLLRQGLSARDCVFLDIELFRTDIHSIGQHMLLYNKSDVPAGWGCLKDCIQPNNLRHYDALHDFPSKYPFATIHFLLGIIGTHIPTPLPDTAFAPLFFTDAAWQNLLRYPENCLNWLSWLATEDPRSPLHPLFHGRMHTLHDSMVLMYNFYRERDAISITNERGDRLRISTDDGSPFNLVPSGGGFALKPEARGRIERFIRLIGGLTGWEYKPDRWTCWEALNAYRFTKAVDDRLKGSAFNKILAQNPLSLAITAQKQIEYTLETPDRLP